MQPLNNPPIKQTQDLDEICAKKGRVKCRDYAFSLQESGQTDKAKKLYKSSCKLKNYVACNDLAVLLEGENNNQGAKMYLQTACESGNAMGCFNHGRMLKNEGNSTAAKKQHEKGLRLKQV
jgi:TPR repeat protein